MAGKPRTSKQAAAKPDGRRARTEVAKQVILDTAIDLIAKEGLAHVTLQRVAERAKVSSGLVVFHFRSKDNLLRSVLQYLDAEFDAEWNRHVRAEGLTLVQQIAGGITCADTFAEKNPKWVSAWLAFCTDGKSLALYRKTALPHDKAYVTESRDRLKELIRQGKYTGINPDELSERINCLVFGAWLWCHLNPGGRKAHLVRTHAMALLEQAFPRHFPLR